MGRYKHSARKPFSPRLWRVCSCRRPGYDGFQIVPRFATNVYFNCVTADVSTYTKCNKMYLTSVDHVCGIVLIQGFQRKPPRTNLEYAAVMYHYSTTTAASCLPLLRAMYITRTGGRPRYALRIVYISCTQFSNLCLPVCHMLDVWFVVLVLLSRNLVPEKVTVPDCRMQSRYIFRYSDIPIFRLHAYGGSGAFVTLFSKTGREPFC